MMISFVPQSNILHNSSCCEQPRREVACRQRIHSSYPVFDCPLVHAPASQPAPPQLSRSFDAASGEAISAGDSDALTTIQPMQADAWGPIPHYSPSLHPLPHQRDLHVPPGAIDPVSHAIETALTGNPQIAIIDSVFGGFADQHSYEAVALPESSAYPSTKPTDAQAEAPVLKGAKQNRMAYWASAPGHQKPFRNDCDLLPTLHCTGGLTRSRPASAASSAADDLPVTPYGGNDERADRRTTEYCSAPKLDRTITDVYSDELYSSNFSITSSSPLQLQMTATSPSNDVFSQRINAANSQHLSVIRSPSPTVARTRSPFQTGSPFARLSDSATNLVNLSMAQQWTEERSKAKQQLTYDMQRQGEHPLNVRLEPKASKTISPKDAILEFSEANGDTSWPLFPPDPIQVTMSSSVRGIRDAEAHDPQLADPNACNNAEASSAVGFAQPPTQDSASPQSSSTCFPSDHPILPRLGSSSSSTGTADSTPTGPPSKPLKTGADGGTYTCTYHGCTLRFGTPMLLQRHKREGHRQTQGINGPREIGTIPNFLNTQAGPHRCDRINPSTGKPCHTVFSRPYDLTRHEDTIHNARKQKVRCELCIDDKSFSRADALTRHYRVCHPEMELPGKHRRRGGA